VMQESEIDDLIFNIPKLIAYLSQGSTLPAGTLIVTGTPSGVGFARKPPVSLKEGDVFEIEVTGGVGTLVNNFVNEK
jgi:2-keto-4-pentenoate hydratase/2-oxohepta-3-ene-1,7-dioic acid hydratase in catechol pathway